MTVVTFVDYVPPPRADTLPWTAVRVEEAPTSDGPWTPLETRALSGIDTDPLHPQARALTTELATLATGWYRLVFVDASGDEATATPAVQNLPTGDASLDQVTPTLADIGALLHARTNSGGTELGTFTADTTPTGDQVAALITMAIGDLGARVGVGIPTLYAAQARRLVALQTSSLVEASYFPGELDTDRSAYRQFQAMYLSGVESLILAITRPQALRLV